jgi:hypothetical protein
MNRKSTKLSFALLALSVSVLPTSWGQVAPQPPATAPESTPTPSPTPLPNVTTPEEEAPVELSPFVVSGEDSQRYLATSTLAGTRVNTDLDNIGSAIQVVTNQFLLDTGSKDAEDLLVYTTNTEVGGIYGNFSGLGSGANLNETADLLRPDLNTRVRGLASADNTRDYFDSDIPWDGYNIGRIDISRGANATLFGSGSPAGIINASTNTAAFHDSVQLTWTFGEHGSNREILDINKVLLKDQLAIRVELLDDDTFYRERPAYNLDKRLFGALRYDPAFLNKHGLQTSLKVNYEVGTVNSNNPRELPPVDEITPWFNSMGKATYDAIYVNNPTPSVPSSGANVPGNANGTYQPWLSTAGLYTNGGTVAYFNNPASPSESGPLLMSDTASATLFGLGPNGTVVGGIGGLLFSRMQEIADYSNYSSNANLPYASALSPYKNVYITDPSIYNFYDQLLDGPNKWEMEGFHNMTVDLSQTYWKNRLGLQAVWSREYYTDGQYSLLYSPNGVYDAITVDINQTLTNGAPNPNVGRPMVTGSGEATSDYSERRNSRYTAFADLNAKDFLQPSWLTSLLGRHVFTAAYTRAQHTEDTLSYQPFATDGSYDALTGETNLAEVLAVSYLGPSIANASSANGLNLPNLQAIQVPSASTVNYFDSHWAQPISSSSAGYVDPGAAWTNPFNGSISTQSANPANYVGWTTGNTGVLSLNGGDAQQLVTSAVKTQELISSDVFVWQAYLLDGVLVPTFSLRKDFVDSWSVIAPQNLNGTYNIGSSSYVIPTEPESQSSGTIHSYSGVIHTPKSLRKHLWGNTDLSLTYNQSSNFEELSGRFDEFGNALPSPTGTTKEYGFAVNTWNGKLTFKANWFKSDILNDTAAGITNTWVTGYLYYAMESNAQRFKLGLSGQPQYSIAETGYLYNYQPAAGQTAAQAATLQAAAVNAALTNEAPDALYTYWNINRTNSADWLTPLYGDLTFQDPVATQNSQSQGVELELDYQPTRNWSLTMNASHDTAQYADVGGNMSSFISNENALINGPAGSLPMYYYGGQPITSVKEYWVDNFYGTYQEALAEQGTSLSEIRPWRFNLVTNYGFSTGILRGINIGGGFRWEDKVGIGYPIITESATGAATFDVAHPYYGPSDEHFDFWIGYERKLTHGVGWRIQLNVREVGENPHLVPVSAQPDGAVAAYRIDEGQSVQLTNTFTF